MSKQPRTLIMKMLQRSFINVVMTNAEELKQRENVIDTVFFSADKIK